MILLGGLMGFQLYLIQSMPPEGQKRMASLVRDTPAGIFWSVAVGFTILVGLVLWILINQKRWSRSAKSGDVQNVKKVALSLWQVEKHFAKTDKDGSSWVAVQFKHVSWSNWIFILPVRPGHPDIEQFRQLKVGDTVEFEALSEGMECALEHELCAYLRIKSIS